MAVYVDDARIPAPVVACALGYCYDTATAHAIAAGGTWSRYPAALPCPPTVDRQREMPTKPGPQ